MTERGERERTTKCLFWSRKAGQSMTEQVIHRLAEYPQLVNFGGRCGAIGSGETRKRGWGETRWSFGCFYRPWSSADRVKDHKRQHVIELTILSSASTRKILRRVERNLFGFPYISDRNMMHCRPVCKVERLYIPCDVSLVTEQLLALSESHRRAMEHRVDGRTVYVSPSSRYYRQCAQSI